MNDFRRLLLLDPVFKFLFYYIRLNRIFAGKNYEKKFNRTQWLTVDRMMRSVIRNMYL